MQTLELKLAKPGSSDGQAETLVVFALQKTKGKDSVTQLNFSEAQKELAAFLGKDGVSSKLKETTFFRGRSVGRYSNVLCVGVGSGFDHENLRQVAGATCKALSANKIKSADLYFDGLGGRDSLSLLRGLVEGLVLATYKFDELKSKKKNNENETGLKFRILTEKATDRSTKKAFEDAVILGEATNFSRRLGDLPGNLMTPTLLADSVVAAAKGTKLKVTVWDKKRIEKERMGGLLGVAQGSEQEPRFIIMEYKGAAASKKPVVFVGKGLTFDTGGISIKPSAGMEEMKYDMCGGANVIGTLLAIAKLGLKVNAVGLVPSTENMPSGQATKPGDVHIARNGKSFEVNNTDAEGRLILADALSYGSELEPQLMVDAATLTGAMVVALGNTHTGYFTRHDKVRDRVQKAASASGEWVWQMPLTDYHLEDIKGTYADLSNISSAKGAGSATAAAFLEQFVGEGIPWAHFDIAGTAWHCGNRLSYVAAKGATGAILRTFVELARQFE